MVSGRTRNLAALALTAVALAACGQEELILPGEREDIRPAAEAPAAPEAARAPALPAMRQNAEWAQFNGAATRLAPHAALSPAPSLRWSASIGRGAARRFRITTAPIVAGGRVFALDAGGQMSAVGTRGNILWQVNLAPGRERAGEGYGGGLAAEGGALVAATGFGEVLRLDPATGGVLWRTPVDGPVRAAPVISGGKVVAVTRGDVALGLDLATGEIDWRVQSAGLGAGLLGGASPAARGPVTVVPFLSGELRAVLLRNGLTVWTTAVTGGRRELVRATIGDITGDPVIDNDVVYAGNQSGRMVALDRRSGERIWTLRDGATGPALPAGNALYLVSDAAELMRVNPADGAVVWRRRLPEFRRPDRRRDAIPHYGPLLAGGRLVVASGDGLLRSFDPRTGALVATAEIPGGAAAQPAIAGGVLYVVSRDGRLHAFQ